MSLSDALFSFEIMLDHVILLQDIICRIPVVAFRLLDYPTIKIPIIDFLSFQNMRKILMNGPNYSLPPQINELKSDGKFVFHKGKSCLFKMNFDDLRKYLTLSPLHIMLLDFYPKVPKFVGSCTVSLQSTIKSMQDNINQKGLSAPCTSGAKGNIVIFNLMSSEIGRMQIGFRLLYLGYTGTLISHIPNCRFEETSFIDSIVIESKLDDVNNVPNEIVDPNQGPATIFQENNIKENELSSSKQNSQSPPKNIKTQHHTDKFHRLNEIVNTHSYEEAYEQSIEEMENILRPPPLLYNSEFEMADKSIQLHSFPTSLDTNINEHLIQKETSDFIMNRDEILQKIARFYLDKLENSSKNLKAADLKVKNVNRDFSAEINQLSSQLTHFPTLQKLISELSTLVINSQGTVDQLPSADSQANIENATRIIQQSVNNTTRMKKLKNELKPIPKINPIKVRLTNTVKLRMNKFKQNKHNPVAGQKNKKTSIINEQVILKQMVDKEVMTMPIVELLTDELRTIAENKEPEQNGSLLESNSSMDSSTENAIMAQTRRASKILGLDYTALVALNNSGGGKISSSSESNSIESLFNKIPFRQSDRPDFKLVGKKSSSSSEIFEPEHSNSDIVSKSPVCNKKLSESLKIDTIHSKNTSQSQSLNNQVSTLKESTSENHTYSDDFESSASIAERSASIVESLKHSSATSLDVSEFKSCNSNVSSQSLSISEKKTSSYHTPDSDLSSLSSTSSSHPHRTNSKDSELSDTFKVSVLNPKISRGSPIMRSQPIKPKIIDTRTFTFSK